MSEHKHAALITEWVKDTSRVVEIKTATGWHETALHYVLECEDETFRFDDTVKPEVTSPLSDVELTKVWGKAHEYSDHYERRRAIANAAHARCLQDEAKAREELIARYDSLQSQYAELSVALDSAAQECDCEHWQYCGICATPEQREILKKPTPAPKPQTVTSMLTYDEIVECLRGLPYEGEINKAVRVANTAAKAQDALTRKAVIAEIMALSYKLASEPDLKDREYNAIAHFLASLPELLKEPK